MLFGRKALEFSGKNIGNLTNSAIWCFIICIKGNSVDILIEFWTFLKVRKKIWLAPIIFVLIVMGGLLVIAKGSVFAPFIYTLF